MSKIIGYALFLSFLLWSGAGKEALSQQLSSVSGSTQTVDTGKTDTNFVLVYKNYRVIGLWQSERRFDIDLMTKSPEPTH
jgi:hypothetical protein